MLLPFILMVSSSFKTSAEIHAATFHLLPEKLTFHNYTEVFANGKWGRWFLNTVYVTAVVTGVSLLFNSLGGFAFARLEFKGRNLLFMLMMLGLMIPSQITMIPVFLIIKTFPLTGGNNIFGFGGTGLINTYGGLMINHFAGAFGVFLCRQYFLNFPKSLDEAAAIDGCSPWRTYFQIYLPLSQPLLATFAVLKITDMWNDYMWPLIIVNKEDLMNVQLGLTVFKNEVIHWELLMAGTTVVALPLIVLFLLAQRFFLEGIVTTGIKG
ncbi:carbohydrate ABC transporter permease [Paenibacillus piri]|uniref:Carbohydrate ABC transporter permease n=2 Tax=Paenibacillus piri TaxID=2547395 RepID=A0A4V2ZS63_9BACL|nr:carbohydrate ABC transporter permease [Paenibacillus piri]